MYFTLVLRHISSCYYLKFKLPIAPAEKKIKRSDPCRSVTSQNRQTLIKQSNGLIKYKASEASFHFFLSSSVLTVTLIPLLMEFSTKRKVNVHAL